MVTNPTQRDDISAGMLNLNGRTALVTGGSRGLGRAIARRFLEAGASVIIVARRENVLRESAQDLSDVAGDRLSTHVCDVSDRVQLENLFTKLRDAAVEIDILVNNAGSANVGKFEEITDERWQADLDLKLFAAIRLSRFVLPGMKARKWGRILNVVAIIGKTPGPQTSPTSISRAAGIAMSKVMAAEFAPYGILVNALCTGRIHSDQLEARWATRGAGKTLEEFTAEQSRPIPLGRLGTAEEFANVALFLASDSGSYVTGTAINIDGGLCQAV